MLTVHYLALCLVDHGQRASERFIDFLELLCRAHDAPSCLYQPVELSSIDIGLPALRCMLELQPSYGIASFSNKPWLEAEILDVTTHEAVADTSEIVQVWISVIPTTTAEHNHPVNPVLQLEQMPAFVVLAIIFHGTHRRSSYIPPHERRRQPPNPFPPSPPHLSHCDQGYKAIIREISREGSILQQKVERLLAGLSRLMPNEDEMDFGAANMPNFMPFKPRAITQDEADKKLEGCKNTGSGTTSVDAAKFAGIYMLAPNLDFGDLSGFLLD